MEARGAWRHVMRLAGTAWVGWVDGLAILGLAIGTPAVAQISQLYSEKQSEPEAGEYVVQHVRTDALKFRFIAPLNWEVRPDGTNTALLLTAPDLSAAIRLGLDGATNAAPPALQAQPYRERLLSRLPGSEVIREFPCVADGQKGTCFDLARVVGRSTQAVFRIAFIPYPGGMAEFELRTSTNFQQRARSEFQQVLGSFHVEGTGAPVETGPARAAQHP